MRGREAYREIEQSLLKEIEVINEEFEMNRKDVRKALKRYNWVCLALIVPSKPKKIWKKHSKVFMEGLAQIIFRRDSARFISATRGRGVDERVHHDNNKLAIHQDAINLIVVPIHSCSLIKQVVSELLVLYLDWYNSNVFNNS